MSVTRGRLLARWATRRPGIPALTTHPFARWVMRRPGAAVLGVLPLVLLLLDANWIHGRLYHDAWIYFGHMQNFSGHLRQFSDLYAAARLSVVLPGAVAYKLFPPAAANVALHLGLYYLAVGALYDVLARTAGRRAALTIGVFAGCHFFFLEAVGWDYVDGYVIAYFLAALAAAARAAESPRWRAWALLSGAAAAAMVVANLTAAVLTPAAVALFLAQNYYRRRNPWARAAVWWVLGAAALIAVLGYVNWRVTGRFWFLAAQLGFAKSATAAANNPFQAPILEWVGWAYWLVVPAVAAGTAALRLGRIALTRRLPARRRVVGGLIQLQLMVVFGGLLALQTLSRYSFIQYWYYASFLLLPLSLLALGEAWGGWLGRLTRPQFRLFVAALVCAMVASATAPPLAAGASTGGALAAAVTVVLAGLVAAWPAVAGVRPAAVLAAPVLLAAVNGLCRHEFQVHTGFPHTHLSQMLCDECQALDGRRADVHRAIADCTRVAREVGGGRVGLFWFDTAEPLGAVYDNAACTAWWHMRYVSRDFPNAAPSLYMDPRVQPGLKILVLSQDPDAMAKAVAAARARNVALAPAGQHRVGRGAVRFTVSVLTILDPLPLPDAPAPAPPVK